MVFIINTNFSSSFYSNFFYYFVSNTKILEDFKNTNLPLYNFLINKWFIDELYEIIFINLQKN